MFDFIVKYWVEFAFGLIVAGGGFFIKRYWAMSKAEHKREQEQFYNQIKNEIEKSCQSSAAGDEQLQKQIDESHIRMEALRMGILSIQGKNFCADCQRLLEDGHVITLDEFQSIDQDHEAYNALGGNHNGDHLFELVKRKAENNLTN